MDSSSISIDPRPGFVAKTRVSSGPGHGKKLFINVCHHARVPRPDIDFEPARVFPLIIANEWEVPICVSKQRDDNDKQGMPCFVVDCCINTECMTWVHLSPDLLGIVVEWCLEALETINEYELDRNWLVPKMLSKGELGLLEMDPQSMHSHMDHFRENEQLALLEELKVESEPNDELLPNLLDIGGRKQKIAIEEIDDSLVQRLSSSHSTSDVEGGAPSVEPESILDTLPAAKTTISPKPKRPLIQEIESNPMDSTNTSSAKNATAAAADLVDGASEKSLKKIAESPKSLKYDLTMSINGTNLLIRVQCSEIPTVEYDLHHKHLVITPPAHYTFEGKPFLEVPVPLSTQITHECANLSNYINTFYERELHALMVFLPLKQ